MSRLFPITALLMGGLVLLLLSCDGDRDEEIRSDNTEIARLLTDDAEARAIFPRIWIDTTDHTDEVSLTGRMAALDYISPSDYWVEILAHRRGYIIRDSCAADSLNVGDPCGDIRLETGARAPAKVVRILDTMDCRYHLLVGDGDSVVTVSKDSVRLLGSSWVLMAQLGISEAHYNGWDIYGVGRQRQAENYVGNLPHVDSVRIRSNSGTYNYYPEARVSYQPRLQLPEIESGERFTVWLFTSRRTPEGELFFDAFLHQREGGEFRHRHVGVNIGENYSFQATESSGLASRSYSQLVIELFPSTSFRDDAPDAFGTSLIAITYQVK